MKRARVAVLETKPESVLRDYERLLALAGFRRIFPKDKEVILKLNLSWTLYFPACSTQPWQLEGVLRAMRRWGYKKITAVENETVVTNARKGAELNKWMPILERYGVDFVPLNEAEWVPYAPKHELLVLDSKVFPDGFEVPKMLLGKNIVHLPTQKTHGHTVITGAMKNAFGGLLRRRRHHSHKHIHEVLVDLLTIQKEMHPHIFAVMDGTVCGDGAGPRTMTPRIGNRILASEDQVAIDAVSAKMMGFEPMEIPFIRIAHERGLGIGDISQISVVGDDIRNVNYGFRVGESVVVFGDKLFRKGALSFVEPVLFRTPLFGLCVLGSAVYHDWIWYPTVGKQRIKRFAKTEWGKLFERL
ncbi:MAG: DUF362 domain-containing protein [Candidatus Micrarchaeota archaeon]